MDSDWENTTCTVCKTRDAERVLDVPHPDAPNGLSSIVQCTRCGLRRLDPRPGPRVISRYYRDNYGAYTGRRRGPLKQEVWDLVRDICAAAPGRGRRLQLLRPLARRIAGWTFDINVPLDGDTPPHVLDVGCGYGDLLVYLQSRGCLVQGVDIDRRAAAQGRQHGVPIHVGRVQDLQLPVNSIDVAILCHSLEHLPDPAETVAALSRVVKPGGHVHIALPNGRAVGPEQEAEGWGALFLPIHFWFFDASTLTELLRKHGFGILSVRYATIWKNHWKLWRSRLSTFGCAAVARQALRFCRQHALDREGGDILRVAAVKVA